MSAIKLTLKQRLELLREATALKLRDEYEKLESEIDKTNKAIQAEAQSIAEKRIPEHKLKELGTLARSISGGACKTPLKLSVRTYAGDIRVTIQDRVGSPLFYRDVKKTKKIQKLIEQQKELKSKQQKTRETAMRLWDKRPGWDGELIRLLGGEKLSDNVAKLLASIEIEL